MLSKTTQIDNIAIKTIMYTAGKGDFMLQHVHKFDHAHLVGSGSVRVIVEGEPDKIYHQGDVINIKKHKAHKLIAETDGAVSFCIHALRDYELDEEGNEVFETVII